jgi:hypothetical protein
MLRVGLRRRVKLYRAIEGQVKKSGDYPYLLGHSNELRLQGLDAIRCLEVEL